MTFIKIKYAVFCRFYFNIDESSLELRQNGLPDLISLSFD